VITNNRYVAMINATRARIRELVTERDRLKETELIEKRNLLSKVESDYANLVLAIRRSYREIHDKLVKDLETEPVKIALGVMTANFETPRDMTADQILASLDKRIEKIEQEIFSENITLEVDNGSMYVDVSVGNKTARMVLDSGATLVSLPATTATELGINIPADARKMQLIMADGRTIDARAVTLARVRVGEFEATNVEAAILDAAATGAEPLLGMSYLSNFKFEIDSAAKSLKMLRVGSDKE
jgi:clan AA aspartic protease (TIGR02281 family)